MNIIICRYKLQRVYRWRSSQAKAENRVRDETHTSRGAAKRGPEAAAVTPSSVFHRFLVRLAKLCQGQTADPFAGDKYLEKRPRSPYIPSWDSERLLRHVDLVTASEHARVPARATRKCSLMYVVRAHARRAGFTRHATSSTPADLSAQRESCLRVVGRLPSSCLSTRCLVPAARSPT